MMRPSFTRSLGWAAFVVWFSSVSTAGCAPASRNAQQGAVPTVVNTAAPAATSTQGIGAFGSPTGNAPSVAAIQATSTVLPAASPVPLATASPSRELAAPAAPAAPTASPSPAGQLAAPTAPAAPTASPLARAAGPKIKLARGDFDPSVGRPSLSSPDAFWLDEDASGQTYYVVQFNTPPSDAAKSSLAAVGARVMEYLPEFAYVVRVDHAQLPAIRAAAGVRWVGLFQPAFRTSPLLDTYLQKDDGIDVQARTFPGENQDSLVEAATRLGATVLARTPGSATSGGVIRVTIPGRKIAAFASLNGLAWVEPFVAPKLSEGPVAQAIAARSTRRPPRETGGGAAMQRPWVALCSASLVLGALAADGAADRVEPSPGAPGAAIAIPWPALPTTYRFGDSGNRTGGPAPRESSPTAAPNAQPRTDVVGPASGGTSLPQPKSPGGPAAGPGPR